MKKGRLSIAILINERKIPAWIYSSIERLVQSGNADVTLLVRQEPAEPSNTIKESGAALMFLKLIEKLDYLIFRSRQNYNRQKDIDELQNLTAISGFTDSFSKDDPVDQSFEESLLKAGSDVIVCFGRHLLTEAQLKIPRYGVWSFSIDFRNNADGLDYGFGEVFRYKTMTCSALEVTRGSSNDKKILFGSRESTCPFSINKNRNALFYRASLFLSRAVNGVSSHGEEYIIAQTERHRQWDCSSHDNDILSEGEGVLSLRKALTDAMGYFFRVARLVVNKILYTDAFSWKLLIDREETTATLSDSFSSFVALNPPRGVFWADPFVIKEDNTFYLFVEEYIYKRGKAHISVIESDQEGNILRRETVLEKPYHLSYPFLFKSDNSLFMIPETASNRTIEIYRCTRFPNNWKLEMVLMKDILATDTTLFPYNDKWWLFTTIDQTNGISGGSTELFLFYADTPFAEKWISHPLNPVVSDESTARCAGNLFLRNGQIFRPSQDCSVRYGRRLNINRVTKLNQNEYEEVMVKRVEPDWDNMLKGMHTINFEENFTIIDVYKFHCRTFFR